MAHQHGEHSPGEHHPAAGVADPGMADVLDLDAEVLRAYLTELTGWIHDLAVEPPVRRILDLGSGTGTGTLALLRRFPDSDVVAVDASVYLLDRLVRRAGDLGLGQRVRVLEADLDATWPLVGPVDLVWASSSLHHLIDPDRALAEVFSVLRPGGLLVVAELDSFPRFLPDDVGIGRPGLEARVHAVLAADRAVELPAMGSPWGARLSAAGFTVQAERAFAIELTSPLPPATGRYAQACLRRVRSALEGRLSADDLDVLDVLTDGDGPLAVVRREDLVVRADRRVWIGRRP